MMFVKRPLVRLSFCPGSLAGMSWAYKEGRFLMAHKDQTGSGHSADPHPSKKKRRTSAPKGKPKEDQRTAKDAIARKASAVLCEAPPDTILWLGWEGNLQV